METLVVTHAEGTDEVWTFKDNGTDTIPGEDLVVVELESARTALEKANTIQETKQVLDAATAAGVYAKRQGLSEEIVAAAFRIRIDALRQLGKKLKESPRNTGAKGIGKKVQSSASTTPEPEILPPPTLKELGITKDTSSLAQRVAAMPKATFMGLRNGGVTMAEVLAKPATTEADKSKSYIPHKAWPAATNGAHQFNATINRDLAALERSFTLAVEAEKIPKKPKFPHLKEAPPRDGFMEDADYIKLAQHAKELWLRTLLACWYTFGIRNGELIGDKRRQHKDALRVRHVDLLSRKIRLKETKNGDDRIVPMTQEICVLMAACVSGKGPDDFVFTRENGTQPRYFDDRWKRLFKEAGVEYRRIHDNRRSALRNMIRRGIPELVAMKISGHKTRSVFDRYNIVSDADLIDATRKTEAAMEAAREEAVRTVHSQSIQSQGPNDNQEGETSSVTRYN